MSTLAGYRQHRGLSQQQVADALGLSSKGHVSDLESGSRPAGLRLALQIQRWSGGAVKAESLIAAEDAELLRAALADEAAPQPEGAAA